MTKQPHVNYCVVDKVNHLSVFTYIEPHIVTEALGEESTEEMRLANIPPFSKHLASNQENRSKRSLVEFYVELAIANKYGPDFPHVGVKYEHLAFVLLEEKQEPPRQEGWLMRMLSPVSRKR